MALKPNDYDELVKKASPKSKTARNMLVAFLVGGTICTIGQVLVNLYMSAGIEKKDAFAVASVTLVFISALLTGLKVYDNIAKHAGAGTLVPITGFANAVVSPALEFKSEGLITGLGAKMFLIAGPVIVYGVITATLYGIIIYLFGLT